jgi:SAM-dependent methyltransferase
MCSDGHQSVRYNRRVNRTHLEYLASPAWAERLLADLVPWIDSVAELGDDVLEVGPGPGLTTDILRSRAARVTAIEVDAELAGALAERLEGTNVTVLHADASKADLASGRFSAATCFSVLHHVPSVEAQDELLAEICRVLQPGAALFAVDARDLDFIRDAHEDDTFVPLHEHTLVERLLAAGFEHADVEIGDYELRFIARKSGSDPTRS